jgi:hypothetical protein
MRRATSSTSFSARLRSRSTTLAARSTEVIQARSSRSLSTNSFAVCASIAIPIAAERNYFNPQTGKLSWMESRQNLFFDAPLVLPPFPPPPNPVSSRSIIISANHHTQHAPRPSPRHPSREEDVAVLLLCRLAASFRRVVLLPSPPPPRRDSARPDSSRWWWDRPPPYDDGIGITVRERSPRRPRPPPPPPRRLP